MPIGSYRYKLTLNPIKRLFRLVLGVPDPHTHLRLRPVLNYVDDFFSNHRGQPLRVLELGCGQGINLFELASRTSDVTGVGYDLNRRAITSAADVAAHLFPDRLRFEVADACSTDLRERFDLILLIDFLEHIPDPEKMMRRVSEHLLSGGRLLISVPTPRYPAVFGCDFHRSIGHLVDGYDLPSLDALVPKDLRLIQSRYNTGLFASVVCAIFYRSLRKLPKNVLLSVLRYCTTPFVSVDLLNGPRWSCSLFAVYEKV